MGHGSGDIGRDRLPFLDGIRAFAVIAVVLYHAGVEGVSGGLLGVDVFFVLSGFLITSLLCEERIGSGAIRFGRFWANRARRLLPGLFVLLLGVALYAFLFRNSVDVSTIRGDAIATLFYFANWHFVFASQGYFAQGVAPSPLLHMWSLSVEEQYYLVWPLAVLGLLRLGGPRAVAYASAVGAVCSAVLMGAMFEAGYSVDRLYYGTDTRAQALLVGSMLGALAVTRQWRVVPEKLASRAPVRVAGRIVTTLSVLTLLWAWHAWNGDGQDPLLYKGGFLLVAVATAVVIGYVTSWRTSVLARVLSVAPIRYIGRISYGLYLYHWPLFLAIDSQRTGLTGAALLTVRLGSALAAAVISFHLVEQPIRRGRLARSWRGLGLAGGTTVATVAVMVAVTVSPAVAAVSMKDRVAEPLPALARQLRQMNAFTTNPVRFMLVGDSVAMTASVGLGVESVSDYGVRVMDAGVLGCDLTPQYSWSLAGRVWPGGPSDTCWDWHKTFSGALNRSRPEVVGVLIGRWELANHLYDGGWVHVGEATWDGVLENAMDQLVSLLGSRGARVIIYTFPYIDPPDVQLNGSPYPENLPSRVDAWNAILRSVAASHPATTLVNLNAILDPGGHYDEYVDGIGVRLNDDGIHVSKAGGEWLQSFLLPEVQKLGVAVYEHANPEVAKEPAHLPPSRS